MDAFFVSVEEALNPELRGKPVVVGGDPKGRGVVSAASYKAREYGIRSAMPMAQARRLCPRAIFLRGSMRIYAEFSSRIMTILERYTPAVEQVSVDEAYLDITGCERFHKSDDSLTIAQRIHHSILKEVKIPASIGAASNKLIAKIAANSAKPNGIMMIRPGYEASFLGPLPIDRMPGIGPAAMKAYRKMGIRVIGDLARFEPELLERVFGKYGGLMARRARGEDTREIMCGSETGWLGNGRGWAAKSVSREVTYPEDTEDFQRLLATLSYLSESVGRRVRSKGLYFRGVAVKLRYSDFKTYTRSRALLSPSNDSGVIFRSARDLLDQLSIRRARVRLIGVSVTTADPVVQLDLFAKSRKAAGLALVHQRMDQIRDRFGFESVLLARSSLHSARHS
ncbi:DNA polymerase IV [hydrothermal vent metagenome]|uniref:DNA-directed DNA polymerase n=1 Tax=hydrothermal vent metagenome TaxID=652676 RepID=A0A3B1CC95_9ZZZZ